MTTVCLEISSFIGMSLGAKHYYGTLKGYVNGEYRSIDLEYRLTAEQALKLSDDTYQWREGYKYQGYDTKEQIRKQAIETYRELFPGATVLVEGQFAYIEDKPILDGVLEK